jgi:hypothetical protein
MSQDFPAKDCAKFADKTRGCLRQIEKQVCAFTTQELDYLLHSPNQDDVNEIMSECSKWAKELLETVYLLKNREPFCNGEGIFRATRKDLSELL